MRIIYPLLLFFGILAFNQSVNAQQFLKYPIPELGYCRDAKECYLYCEIPENSPACWSYGKYQIQANVLGETDGSKEVNAKTKQLGITFPITELGNCSNVNECRSFCEKPDNRQACFEFAKKKGFHKEEERKDEKMLSNAKQELGCTSMESCRDFCSNPDNQNRCREFAKKMLRKVTNSMKRKKSW